MSAREQETADGDVTADPVLLGESVAVRRSRKV